MNSRPGKRLLLAAGLLSGCVAALHVGVMLYGADAYRYFGAGERMARMAEMGSSGPAIITTALVLLFGAWAAHAFRNLSVSPALALLLWAAPTHAAEFRPTVSLGQADVVGGHLALNAALRVQIASAVYVQGEYVALLGDGHTDRGPAFQVGLSGRSRSGLRPFIGLGGGPVKGYGGDDGLRYVAAGAAHPLGSRGRGFVQAELRVGLLGESAYRQVTIGLGVSR